MGTFYRYRLSKFALLVALAFAPSAVHAADPARIHRQQDANGRVAFSDVPAGRARTAYRVEPVSAASSRAAAACSMDDPATLQSRAMHWRDRVHAAARRHALDPALFEALVQVESCFDPTARSRAGAQGMTQLMPGTARALGVADPFDAAQNLDGGARYLARMLARYGDETLALAAYNAGPGNVDRHGGVPPFRETQRYLARIAALLDGR